MKVKLDENLPAELAEDLRAAGHEADTVHDEDMTGSPDTTIVEQARIEGRIFFTLDKSIADVRAYPPERYAGIVLFRPPTSGRGAVLAFVRRHLAAVFALELSGHLLIVTEGTIRRR